MILKLSDTIAAISTPPGRGGIGVVRLSGPAARDIVHTFVELNAEPRPWSASLGRLLDDERSMVDEVVVTYFAAPRSYTSEDVIEISCHGAPIVLRHALDR